MSQPFTPRQIAQLTNAFHRGAAESSLALGHWLNASVTLSIDAVDQCPLEVAISVLGAGENPVCVSLMEMEGTLAGHMLLAFDDASGLAIPDLLMTRVPGTSSQWSDLEISCVQETMNIAGSAYLNGVARDLTERSGQSIELIPSPPHFLRDFAESLLESAFMDQALAVNDVVFARTRFDLAGQPLRWTFLLIPNPESLKILSDILASFP
jgi:chemotaxis protein CheY-P-specific phosphatase CheC